VIQQGQVFKLKALALERAVDAGWTSNRSRADALRKSDSKPYRGTTQRHGRSVDAEACPRRSCRQRKQLTSRNFAKPSNGLEPLNPSLP
jgi:hypothetical protein